MRRVLLFAALVAWSAMASAVVYKWADADGKIHYGDLPPDGVKAEVVEMLTTHATPPPPTQAARPAAPSTASATAARTAATRAAQLAVTLA